MNPGIAEAARGFEALIFRQLLRAMRGSARPSGPLSGGRGGAVFSDLLDQALARSAAAGPRGLGVAGLILRRYA